MHNPRLAQMLLLSALFLVAPIESRLCHAAVRTTQSPEQENWPRNVEITVGEVRTRIDGPKMWTLSGIDFQGAMMATQESAYGTVLTIRDVGHLGTAHFLDVPGKPGEVEKEIVTSLQFFVDEKPVTQLAENMNLNGSSFRMERTSTIREMDLKTTVSLRDGVLIETADLHFRKPMDLQKAHPAMYAWTPEATVYVFGDERGIQKRGSFIKEGKGEAKAEKDAKWMAVFNPANGKGSVCYLLKHPPGAEGWFLIVDAPGVYRKQALYTLVDKVPPEGFGGTYQTAVTFFTANEADWEATANQKAMELKAIRERPVASSASSTPSK